jgi:hypothetical protein
MATPNWSEHAGHSDRYISQCRGRSINLYFGSILSIVCLGTRIKNAGISFTAKQKLFEEISIL